MSTEKNFWEKYSQLLIKVSEGEHTLEEVLSAVSGSVNKYGFYVIQKIQFIPYRLLILLYREKYFP